MTIILSETEICQRFNVTPEQLAKADRVIDLKTGKVFYQVSSQTDLTKEPYEVRYNSLFKRLTCTCPAGNPPINERTGEPLYAPRNCWHKRAASAAAFEYRQQENIQARKEAEEAARKAEEESQARAYASDKEWQKAEREAEARERRNRRYLANDPAPFSLLK